MQTAFRLSSRLSLLALAGLIPALAASASASASAQAPEEAQQPESTSSAWAHQQSDLPADPRVHYGQFDNGMRWAWANHAEPQQRVYLRLHVNVGSLAETESERGMAHFLEHMAFNGSKNFAAGTLIEWFQEQGMSFGADTNAHTAFSETVYKLDLPGNDEETLREGLLVLRDFAGELTISDEEVEAEKGVIDSEERERDSAGFRAFIQVLEAQYAGTLYPDRLPIGTKQARDAFTGESVRAFYRQWYRPEHTTLVIVGDLGDRNPEALMAEYFAGWQRPEEALLQEPSTGQLTFERPIVAVQDDELPSMQMSLAMVKPEEEPQDSRAERLQSMTLSAAHSMVNLRFSEKLKEPDTTYLGASVSSAGEFGMLSGGNLSVATTPENWQQGLEDAYVEVRRALNYGFAQAELDELRAEWKLGLAESVEREATIPSAVLLDSILLEIEEGIVPTSAAFDLELFGEALDALTVEDCLEALRDEWRGGTLWMNAVGPVVIEDAEASLTAIYEKAKARKVERGVERAVAQFAYASDPEQAGEIAERSHVEDLDLHLVRFANGTRLNLKQTDFREREILVTAQFGRGGMAMPQDDAVLPLLGATLYNGGALEAHSADDLRRLMAGRQVGATFAMSEDRFVITGGTTADDLLFQLELMQATLQHPGYRPDLLPMIQSQLPLIFQQFEVTAQGPLMRDFIPALMSGDKRANIMGLTRFAEQAELAAFSMEDLQAAFEGPLQEGPIELTIVGDFEVEAAVAAVAQTFGSMPMREEVMLPAVMPQAKLEAGISLTRSIQTQDEKASVFMVFPTTDGFDERTRRHLSFLGTVVDDRLRLRVREELGAAYSPSALADSSETWLGLGGILIAADGVPADAAQLVAACRAVGEELASEGITQEEVDRLIAPILNQIRDAQRLNGYWISGISEAQSKPQTLDTLRSVLSAYENLDLDFLNELAAKYLLPERSSTLLVLPQTVEAVEEE